MSDYVQYNYEKQFEKDNYYITVIGDFITEVWLDEEISKKIHSVYQKSQANDGDALNTLKGFLEAKVKNKIKISRNNTPCRGS